MIPVVSVQQMREIDQLATKRYGVPSIVLMELAGRSVVEELGRRFAPIAGSTILVATGKGNNGGDGFVAARHALRFGARVTILLAGNRHQLRGDAKTNFDILASGHDGELTIVTSFSEMKNSHQHFDFIIDALFGTSFHGEAAGEEKKIIEWINAQRKATIVSIDIPSGLDAERGCSAGSAVHADLTVTMAFPKPGLYLQRGPALAGSVAISDIHIPRALADEKSAGTFLVEESDVARSLPRRPRDSHKNSVGRIFVLAGSKGLTGAALLSSMSALKSGAGAVVLGIPSAVFPAVSRRTLEVMPLELPSTDDGSLSGRAIAQIDKKIKWADVVLMGPGLSRNSETMDLVVRLVGSSTKTLVLDADALNAVSAHPGALKKRKCSEVVLTPHLGEFSRLTSLDPAEIEADKISIARAYARSNEVILVLKGAPTIVVSPRGKVFINATGNPGMSTAGSGDVLGGIIAALIGQGNSSLEAAVSGVFVHGRAGDLARDQIGERGMVAGDIMHRVPAVFRSLDRSEKLGRRSP